MKRILTGFLSLLVLLCAATVFPVTAEEEKKVDLQALNQKLLEQLTPSLVDLEYYFLPDETGKRDEFSVAYQCPNCKGTHYQTAATLIREQRPFRVPAYAIAEDEFISASIGAKREWLEKIDLVFQGKRYPAKIVACYPEEDSVLLKTDSPVSGVVPLKFNAKAEGARFAFFRGEEDGIVRATITAWTPPVMFRDFGTGKDYVPTIANTVVVSQKGEVIGLSMHPFVEVGIDPAGQPNQWKKVSIDEYEKTLTDFHGMLEDNIFPVQIQLKPFNQPVGYAARFLRSDEKRNEADGIGVKMKDGRILIVVSLVPSETARLSRILLHTKEGKEIPAKFVGSLRFFGGIIAEPEQPLPGDGIAFFSGELAKLNFSPIYRAKIKTFGKRLDLQVSFKKLDSFEVGFRGMLVPDYEGFVFSRSGELLALPLSFRRGVSEYRNDENQVATSMVQELVGDFDPLNIPQQGPEQIAWLGIEYQRLDEGLARANNVELFTEGGDTGLLVSHVYPDSSAAKMGIELGDILLSVRSEEMNAPTVFRGYEFERDMENFPWDQYDQIPPQYYDQLPTPWGSIRNRMSQILGDIGIGGKARLSILHKGEPRELKFTISAAPMSFDTAEKFNDPKLGISVGDLTYEVRNYFRLKPENDGVIVAAVKAGGRAAVAGLRPYEIITTINGEPVKDQAMFRKLQEGKAELKIGVRRFAVTRIVTINPTTATPPAPTPEEVE